MIPGLQEIIHRFEEGEGTRWVRRVLIVLVVLTLAAVYNLREYQGFNSVESMDAAQLARNISRGDGFTTRFIRPLSLHLIELHRDDGTVGLESAHPDLANPPLYPLLLAGLMKVAPIEWNQGDYSRVYQPELWIAFLNQALFLVSAALVFKIGRRLFDVEAAATATALWIGAEVLWRFSVSGHSTMLLLVIFLGAVLSLIVIEEHARVGDKSAGWQLGMCALTGLLLGLAMMTRYAAGWIVLPVAAYIAWVGGARRWACVAVAIGVFVVVAAPWIARNVSLCGAPFGTATFSVVEDTRAFPGDLLGRTLKPDLGQFGLAELTRKFFVNLGAVLQDDLPRLGGSWVAAFFLVGLLVPFQNPALHRLRMLVVALLFVLIPVQALGRTSLSALSPEINSENLLILAAPLALVFGAGLFFILLDQLDVGWPPARLAAKTAFIGLGSMGLVFALLPPNRNPIAWPPYYPQLIQDLSRMIDDKELMMSDIPWAVAWFGDRDCVWAVGDVEREFYAIHDYHKPIKALYLTQLTTDAKFFSQMVSGQDRDWEWFLLQSFTTGEVPRGFPLRSSLPRGQFDFRQWGQVFLTDWERWRRQGK